MNRKTHTENNMNNLEKLHVLTHTQKVREVGNIKKLGNERQCHQSLNPHDLSQILSFSITKTHKILCNMKRDSRSG